MASGCARLNPTPAPPGRPLPWWRRPAGLLALVAVAHALSPLLVLGAHWWFGIDESVYLSQINGHAPAGGFSAPRARGATLIAAPVTVLTSSVAAVRIWVAALSGTFLYASFRPWLRLHLGPVVPLAALLFSTIWTTIYYAFEVMPNEWVAFAAVAACAHVLLFLRDGRRRSMAWIVLAVAWMALLRPSDALYASSALVIGVAVARAPLRRRLSAAAAIACGAVVGAAEWVVEALSRYGGVPNRIAAAQAENGGGGLHFAGAAQARALAGPLLCRGSCHVSAGDAYRVWWIALAAFAALGLLVAVRRRRVAPAALPLFVGLTLAAQYVFTVSYAAPRFLTPTYALLVLPAACGILAVPGRLPPRGRRSGLTLTLLAALVAHVLLQVHVIAARVAPPVRRFAAAVRADAKVLNAVGVRGPCLVVGQPGWEEDLAYAAGCTDVPGRRRGVQDRIEDGAVVVWLGTSPPKAAHDTRWRRVDLPWLQPRRPLVALVGQRPGPPPHEPLDQG